MASKIIIIFVLLSGLALVFAACSDDTGAITGNYHAKSDCVSPTQIVDIVVSTSSITSPAGYDFRTLGFPTTTLNVSNPSSGAFNSKQRVCTQTMDLGYNSDLHQSYLYTCDDDGAFACNIYLEEY